MPIKLNAATGGGSVSLSAPNSTTSNADVTLTLPPNDGEASQYLQTNGTGTLSWQTVASLSNAEDGTGTNFEFNSGFGSNGVAYGVRAWIHFDGNAATIGNGDGRGNVSSVTDNGTGDYTLNFSNNMPDQHYAVCGSCSGDTPTDPHLYTGHIGVVHNGFATGSCRIVVTRNQTGGEADIAWNSDQVMVAIVR